MNNAPWKTFAIFYPFSERASQVSRQYRGSDCAIYPIMILLGKFIHIFSIPALLFGWIMIFLLLLNLLCVANCMPLSSLPLLRVHTRIHLHYHLSSIYRRTTHTASIRLNNSNPKSIACNWEVLISHSMNRMLGYISINSATTKASHTRLMLALWACTTTTNSNWYKSSRSFLSWQLTDFSKSLTQLLKILFPFPIHKRIRSPAVCVPFTFETYTFVARLKSRGQRTQFIKVNGKRFGKWGADIWEIG